ncbi:uncharacterized protein [Aristolochia californica]|uniref:uncharacterized protein n=1 Tax=Aristolochia californica TaxID=171875 RepID=UPI0035D89E45
MASSGQSLPLLLSLMCLLAIGASARPCKTLFISYTISSFRPSLKFSDSATQNPSELFVFAEFNDVDPKPSRYFPTNFIPEFRQSARFLDKTEVARPNPLGFSSLRDRTKDILSVVVALLFGVGCGALTSAAMYLVWSLVTNSHDGESDDEDAVQDDTGYAKLPPSPVKKGYEGN